MSNMNVKKRMERISAELSAVRKHIAHYSGINSAEAMLLDNLATQVCEEAAAIAAEARKSGGNTSGGNLVAKVRKALGYTHHATSWR